MQLTTIMHSQGGLLLVASDLSTPYCL